MDPGFLPVILYRNCSTVLYLQHEVSVCDQVSPSRAASVYKVKLAAQHHIERRMFIWKHLVLFVL